MQSVMMPATVQLFMLIYIVGQVSFCYGACPGNMTSYVFGNVFLSNAGHSLARGPLTMVLPSDSEFVLKQRLRRHVVCGRTIRNRKQGLFGLNYEQRAVCPYRHIINKNANRIPEVLEEVMCECDRPSHLSPYTEIRCQPVKYRMPVLYKDENSGEFVASHEELTLACIPLVPKEDDESFEMQPLH